MGNWDRIGGIGLPENSAKRIVTEDRRDNTDTARTRERAGRPTKQHRQDSRDMVSGIETGDRTAMIGQ